MKKRVVLIVGCILMLVLAVTGMRAVVARVFELPAPTGRFAVGTLTTSVPLRPGPASPSAAVLVQMWYPAPPGSDRAPYGYANNTVGWRRWLVRTHAARGAAVAGTAERFPIVFYLAGWGGRRTDNTVLVEELASQGFVVVGLDDAAISLPQDKELSAPLDLSSQAAFERSLARGGLRVQRQAHIASAVLDMLATLDEADPEGRFTHRLDRSRVGIFGFSVGGAAAAEACRQDARFRAALNLDGWLFGPVSTEGFSQPYFVASTAEEHTRAARAAASPPDPSAPFIERLNADDERNQSKILERAGGYRLEIAGTWHSDFSDAPFFSFRRRVAGSAADDPTALARLLGAYVVAFFQSSLNGTPPAPPLVGPSPDPRVTLKAFSATSKPAVRPAG